MSEEKKEIKKELFSIKNLIKIGLVIVGTIIYAIGLKWFVASANVIPSGFTGVGVLLSKFCVSKFGFDPGLTIFNVVLNIIPAIISYKILGKRFTIISFVIMFAFTFIADMIPALTLTTNPLLAAIFGGILCGFGPSLWYRSGVSGGGTDFIALSLSAKYHVETFSYIMIFNIMLIIIQGFLFGLEPAFYSIIFQYISTQAINNFYRHYEARTILIITEKPTLVSKALIKESGHSSTIINGIGSYTKNEKYMIYTVVTQPEVRRITTVVKKYDPNAFINILHSNEIQGNFKYLPVDIDDVDENY